MTIPGMVQPNSDERVVTCKLLIYPTELEELFNFWRIHKALGFSRDGNDPFQHVAIAVLHKAMHTIGNMRSDGGPIEAVYRAYRDEIARMEANAAKEPTMWVGENKEGGTL